MLKRKFTAAILLVCVLVVLVLSGCGNAVKPDGTSSSTSAVVSSAQAANTQTANESTLPLTKEPKTLVFAGEDNWYAPASLTKNLPAQQEIEKKTNVHIEWQNAGYDQYNQAMQTKLGAGVDLPDILEIPGSGDPSTYGAAGQVIPMEDLIVKYCPNIKKIFEKYPNIKKLYTSPDGHIYGMVGWIQSEVISNPTYIMQVRKDWLDKLNLKLPVTTDDLYNVLKAFKEKDPNGNGKHDEIPWGGNCTYLSNAFGLHLYVNGVDWSLPGVSIDANGKVFFQYIDPRYKEYLKYVNKLYKEGLMDKDFLAHRLDDDYNKSVVAKNLVGVYANWLDYSTSWGKILTDQGIKDAHYMPIAPLIGPNGNQWIELSGDTNSTYSISKDCKDPVLAAKWLDFLFSEEGIRIYNYGVEGTSYVIENGKPKYTDFVLHNKDGLSPIDALRSIGAFTAIPGFDLADVNKQISEGSPAGLQLLKEYPEIKDSIKVPYFPAVLPTKAESDRLNALYPDISTYVQEMGDKFILGAESLDKFDQYVSKLKSMGIDEYVKIKQAQYDRFNNSK